MIKSGREYQDYKGIILVGANLEGVKFDSIYVNKICYCREEFFNKFFVTIQNPPSGAMIDFVQNREI